MEKESLDTTRGSAVTIPGSPYLRDGAGHFISTRHGGTSAAPFDTLNLSHAVGDDPAAVDANWARLLEALGVPAETLARPTQVHGADIISVNEAADATNRPADGLVTRTPGLVLTVLVADCAPVIAADPVHRVVGIAHAGWRGTVAGVTPTLIRAMRALGTDPADVRLGIGPCIAASDYEVGEEVARAVQTAFDPADVARVLRPGAPGRWQFDLAGANAIQAASCGVRSELVSFSPWSTRGNPEMFYSHRGSGGRTGRFGAGVWLA